MESEVRIPGGVEFGGSLAPLTPCHPSLTPLFSSSSKSSVDESPPPCPPSQGWDHAGFWGAQRTSPSALEVLWEHPPYPHCDNRRDQSCYIPPDPPGVTLTPRQ